MYGSNNFEQLIAELMAAIEQLERRLDNLELQLQSLRSEP
jgi:exonuclease VII small subunit